MALQKRAPLRLAIFAFAALALAGCGLGRDAGGDGGGGSDPIVAATVNGRPIYREDVRAHAVMRGWLGETEDLDGNSEAFYQALEELIEIRLFAMEAEARGLDREPDVRRQLESARERVLANAIYEQIAQNAADPANIERLYRENVDRLGQGEEVHLRHIQFDTREAADAAKRRLDDGDRFERLAFELSTARNTAPDGGDMGFAAVSDLVPAVREAVNRSTVGQVFGPIQLESGWHLFRLEDRRAINVQSLEQLRPRIIAWLAYREATELNERLARDARIERYRQPEDEGMEPSGDVTEPGDATTTTPQGPTPQLPSADPDAPPFPFPTGPGGGSGAAPPQQRPQQPAQQPPAQAAAQPPATTTGGAGGPTE